MDNFAKTLSGLVLLAIGIVFTALSFVPTIIAPAQTFFVNTLAIMVAATGGFVMFGRFHESVKDALIGVGGIGIGAVLVFWSFMTVDPFTQLLINTVGILVFILGGGFLVKHADEHGEEFYIGIVIAIVGIIVTFLSFTTAVPMGMMLMVNSIGLLVAGFGTAVAIKNED